MSASSPARVREPFLSRKQKHVISRVAFYILMAIILIYILFPFYWALRSSVTPDQDLFSLPTGLWPTNMTSSHYNTVFADPNFKHALVNSVIVAFSVTIIALVIGSFAAYALGRFNFRGKNPVMYLILAMTMFPQVAILGALYSMVVQFNLYDHLTSLILTYMLFTLPFTVWVLFPGIAARARGGGLRRWGQPVQDILADHAAAGFARVGDHRFVGLHRRLERVPVCPDVPADTHRVHRPRSDL
jgi:ABC-type sulfate transport system permease subunit